MISNQTAYSYDDLIQVTNANTHSIALTYDVLNRLWEVTPPPPVTRCAIRHC